jgi:hypothetical protein
MKDNEDAFNHELDGSNATESTTLGIDPLQAQAETANDQTDEQQANASEASDPYGVKKRLGMQAKKHAREMRQMQEQMAQMQAAMTNPNQTAFHQEPHNPFPSPGQPANPGSDQQEMIRQAVAYALQAKEQEAHKAKQAEAQKHIADQYDRLNDELDKGSDKYDDFDEVVRGKTPYTSHIRDALLLVDNPADVAYKLGKNPSELSRISQLHPLDQAREVNKLSFALMGGNSGRGASNSSNPMSNPRPNPANTGAVNSNTPASSIRSRMKAGTWK